MPLLISHSPSSLPTPPFPKCCATRVSAKHHQHLLPHSNCSFLGMEPFPGIHHPICFRGLGCLGNQDLICMHSKISIITPHKSTHCLYQTWDFCFKQPIANHLDELNSYQSYQQDIFRSFSSIKLLFFRRNTCIQPAHSHYFPPAHYHLSFFLFFKAFCSISPKMTSE